jgi:hypothetical protein
VIVGLLGYLGFPLQVFAQAGLPLGRAQPIDGFVASQRYHPGDRLAAGGIVERGFLPNLEKNLLQHVLGRFLVVEHAKGDGKEHARDAIVESCKALPIALPNSAHEIDLGFEVGCGIGRHRLATMRNWASHDNRIRRQTMRVFSWESDWED